MGNIRRRITSAPIGHHYHDGGTAMPREQSELTGMKPRALVARLTERQKIAFLRLGGSKWIRAILQQEVEKHEKQQRKPV